MTRTKMIALGLAVSALAVYPALAREDVPPGADKIPLGINASLGGIRLLSDDSPWNTRVDSFPVDPSSDVLIGSIGADKPLHPDWGAKLDGKPWGQTWVVVDKTTQRVPVTFEYHWESDHALYPIPPNPPVEGFGVGKVPTKDDSNDRHMIIIDRDHRRLYELFAVRFDNGVWYAGSGAVFDLFGDTHRPAHWTSADAAGLPIFPGLVRYDEAIELGKIEHALRFTAPRTRRAYIAPASHWASKNEDPKLPPMGLRVRLKASVDENKFPASVRSVIVCLKRYGMILADNGGPFFVTGAQHPKWNDSEIDTLKRIKGKDFEVVRIGNIIVP